MNQFFHAAYLIPAAYAVLAIYGARLAWRHAR